MPTLNFGIIYVKKRVSPVKSAVSKLSISRVRTKNVEMFITSCWKLKLFSGILYLIEVKG
ncbi:hypothetical protein SAMN05660206_10268 [Sphingobacterium wenxiniae]|uniref:Uncharacterized protein n=1 Tax=Sphingobacterium wenxiniae TaxID=683125 RepID=A0A1I6Q187_9SPHI|nr:hypothetical protein SAMN05660206_10268 [Sphingobacterium wenxiniae]